MTATLRLVDEDGVFAIVNATGTEQNLASRPYLNAARVPQLFVDSGATVFGSETAATRGRSASGRAIATRCRIYGSYVSRSRPGAKIAVLYEDEA